MQPDLRARPGMAPGKQDAAAADARPRVPPRRREPLARGRYLWTYALGIWGIHLLACLAFLPWLFDWSSVIVMVAGVFLFGQGINLGYHRLLAHRALKAPRWLEYALVTTALCTMQDTPIKWVTHHRLHHRYSDQRKDAHTPRAGFYWAHMGWLFRKNPDTQSVAGFSTYARDLLNDPFYRAFERKPWLSSAIYLAHAALFYLAGLAIGWATSGAFVEGVRYGSSLLVWGVLVRTVAVWHITWSVNSICHRFGYRSYATDDGSRNHWLVGLIGAGEGWHNNHHWDQASARHGLRWWEFDLTWMAIRALETLGLATDVKRPRRRRKSAETPVVRPAAAE